MSLPCPFHIGRRINDAAWTHSEDTNLSLAATMDLPYFRTAEGEAQTKAKMVETFEVVARRCGSPTQSAEGLSIHGFKTP